MKVQQTLVGSCWTRIEEYLHLLLLNEIHLELLQ